MKTILGCLIVKFRFIFITRYRTFKKMTLDLDF